MSEKGELTFILYHKISKDDEEYQGKQGNK